MELIVRKHVAGGAADVEVLPVSGMTLGSDGDLYFGSSIESPNETGNQGAISRITPCGQVATFTSPNITQTNVNLTAIGPDKNGSSTNGKGVVLK